MRSSWSPALLVSPHKPCINQSSPRPLFSLSDYDANIIIRNKETIPVTEMRAAALRFTKEGKYRGIMWATRLRGRG